MRIVPASSGNTGFKTRPWQVLAVAAVAAIALGSATPASARGDGGAVGLGILGGVVAGAAIGAATAPYYAPPPPAYYNPYAPAPYYAPPPNYYAPAPYYPPANPYYPYR